MDYLNILTSKFVVRTSEVGTSTIHLIPPSYADTPPHFLLSGWRLAIRTEVSRGLRYPSKQMLRQYLQQSMTASTTFPVHHSTLHGLCG
jgi:hypothetical protein